MYGQPLKLSLHPCSRGLGDDGKQQDDGDDLERGHTGLVPVGARDELEDFEPVRGHRDPLPPDRAQLRRQTGEGVKRGHGSGRISGSDGCRWALLVLVGNHPLGDHQAYNFLWKCTSSV